MTRDFLLACASSPIAQQRPADLSLDRTEDWVQAIVLVNVSIRVFKRELCRVFVLCGVACEYNGREWALIVELFFHQLDFSLLDKDTA